MYQIYIALLKFDFFFFLGFTVQFLVLVSSTSMDAEFALTVAAIPVTIIILVCGAWFVRRETMVGMIIIIVSPQYQQDGLLALTILPASLIRCDGIFLLQAVPNVLAADILQIPTRSTIDDLLRRHHYHLDCDHYHQRLPVRPQLQSRFEAPYQQEEEQGSRKDNRALFKPDPSTITDDDRLITPVGKKGCFYK